MKKIVFFFILGFSSIFLFGQPDSSPAVKKIVPTISLLTHRIGNTEVRLKKLQYGPRTNYVFINLHDNENTAVEGVLNILETYGGTLIKIENGGKRNLQFSHRDKIHSVDPNRIFSRTGIKKNLPKSDPRLVNEIEQFSSRILNLIPAKTDYVIALHNNTDGNLAVNEYLPGNKRQNDARQVHVARGQDADDFFLTTDSLIFHHLAAKNFNSILQDDKNVEQDGSLSVYFGGKNICYINCETEHGRKAQTEMMIAAALNYITTTKKK